MLAASPPLDHTAERRRELYNVHARAYERIESGIGKFSSRLETEKNSINQKLGEFCRMKTLARIGASQLCEIISK